MPRLSNGLFLQVLAARPQAGVPLEVTVWDGANPANMLAQLQNASGIQFQHVQSDVGSGTFRLPVADPKATTANIREGNLVKIRLNDVDVFPYFIEAPKLVVAESGDSLWELKGPGALDYLSQGVVYPPGWPLPTGTDRVWTSATAGTILTTIISEAQGRGALAHITYDFTASVDSLNDPWDANLNLTIHAGTTVLDVVRQLVALGIDVEVTPQLVFRAYKAGTFGTDRSTSTVFRTGRHIVGNVEKIGIRSQLQNGVLVEGAGGKFVAVNDPASIADPYTGRREGSVRFTQSSDPTTLQNAGTAQIRLTEADANAISVALEHDTLPGGFTPYVDYAPGDWVSLDVPGEYAMAKLQCRALTLTQLDNANYGITADLNAVALDYLVRLRNALSATAGTSGGTTGGSSSGALSLGSPAPAQVGRDAPTVSHPGDTASSGASDLASPEDHVHGREAYGAAADIAAETFGATAVGGASAKVANAAHVHAMPANPTGLPLALTGATAATRYVGATASGAPGSGTFAVGDFIIDQTGKVWVCTIAGSPGTWTAVSGGGGGGGGGTDYDKSPNPTAYDDEFKVTAAGVPAGWTQLGTLNVVNANTDWLSCLHLVNNSSGGIVIDGGIYKAAPAVPFTVTARVPDFRRDTNYQAVGLMIYDGTKFYTLFIPFTSTFSYSGTADVATWATVSSRSSITEYSTRYDWPQYIRIVVTSATSMQAYYSLNGLEWMALGGAVNPGLSAATYVGLFTQGNQGGTPSDAYVDWIRFGTNVVQPEARLWQNVGGVSDLVQVATGAGTVEIDGLKGSADAKPATPNAADDEFNSLAAWTVYGTPDQANVTDFPSHFHLLKASAVSNGVYGIYKASPSMPFTMTAKLSDMLWSGSYPDACIGVGDAVTPTKVWGFGPNIFYNGMELGAWTLPSTRTADSNPANPAGYVPPGPLYLRLVVHSSTNVDCYVSRNGLIWLPIATAQNPGLTVGTVWLFQAGSTGAATLESAWDWVRFS